MELQKDIREFVELLLSEKVEFLLVGCRAHAASAFSLDVENVDRVINYYLPCELKTYLQRAPEEKAPSPT